jgi:hypothetical protein
MQNMSKKSVMVWAWVNIEVRESVEKLAELKGVSISEYVRSLVLADLDNRSLFTTRLKKEAGAKGQFNESYHTSAAGLHIAKRQFRDRKICRNHGFAIHFWDFSED